MSGSPAAPTGYGAVGTPVTPLEGAVPLNDFYEKIGFGPAQVAYWFILSLISISDTMEQVLISLVISYIKCEWHLTLFFEATITTSVFFFYGISGVVFGKVADKFGRKKVLTITLIALILTAIGSAAAQNKWQFLIARSMTGACIGANFGVIVAYATEVVESKYRSLGVSLIIFTSKVGMFLTALMGFFFLNMIGWRWFIILVSINLIPALLLLQFVPESPRYLVVSGQREEAKKAVQFMSRLNKVPVQDNIEVVCYESGDLGNISTLLEPTFRKETILLSAMYFGNILIFLSLILFLPLAFNSEFCGGDGKKAVYGCKKLTQKSLIKVTIVVSATMLGLVTAHALSRFTGRVFALRLFSGAVVIFCLFLYKCFSQLVTLILLFGVEFFASGFNILIWIVILENYPTTVRSTASGFVNFWGKLGGVLGVAGLYIMFYISPYLVVTMYVGAALISFIAAMLFDKETRDLVVEDVVMDNNINS